MKSLLFLSDLHGRFEWYEWAARQRAALTAISGDLLDAFDARGLLPQMIALKNWAAAFPAPLALSSGNHDANFPGGVFWSQEYPAFDRESARLMQQECWMDTIERAGVVTDRRSQMLDTPAGKLLVTTIPFHPGPQGPRFCDELWEAGQRQRRGALWLVLHHEPPAGTAVGGATGDPALFYKIQEYQPDFVLSGHIHGQPYSGSFADRIGETWCFNPGCPVVTRAIRTRVPNHIILDLHNRTATWHATANVGRLPIVQTIRLT